MQAVLAASLVLGLALGVQLSARHLPANAWLPALLAAPATADAEAAAAAAEAEAQAAAEAAAAAAAQPAASNDAAAAPEAPDADALAQALSRELEGLPLGEVSVSVDPAGQVVLSGSVNDPQVKARLLEAAQRLASGRRIRDLVFVVEE